MPDYIDLHVHSDHSDGRMTPQQIIDRGLALGLKAVAVTDHDCLSGYEEAAAYAQGKDIEVVAAAEFSAEVGKSDIHILAYLFRPDNPNFRKALDGFRSLRYERGRKMVERLKVLGVKVSFEDVLEIAGKAAIGRPHLAEAMVKNGQVSSYDLAFKRYLFQGGPVYMPKAKLTPAEAIDLIHAAGGLAVMAHPGLTKRDDIIEKLAANGLDGLEIFHPTHSSSSRKRYSQIALSHNLCCTGGSDAHSRPGRYGDIGDEKVPYEYLIEMKKRLGSESRG